MIDVYPAPRAARAICTAPHHVSADATGRPVLLAVTSHQAMGWVGVVRLDRAGRGPWVVLAIR